MSLQDKIAKQLLAQHGPVLDTRTNNGWWTELKEQQEQSKIAHNYERCTVGFGNDLHTVVSCQLADTDELQVIGLSKHASISPDEGMIFPYPTPRKVSFWMSTVPFSLDMIFVGDDGRVTQKVENIEPGDPGRWGMDHISAVIEVNGGFCATHSIEVGTPVYEVVNTRQAQEHFPSAPRKDIDPKPVPPNPTRDRFRDRDLIDQQVKNQPMTPYHEEQYGYDPVSLHDDQGNIAPVRMSMVTKLAAVNGLQPAFMNSKTNQLIKSPGIHDLSLVPLTDEEKVRLEDTMGWADRLNKYTDWIDGFVDGSGKFYTREEAANAIFPDERYPLVLHFPNIPKENADPDSYKLLQQRRKNY
jgi:uncharacterized membrane protein (UPF0127 family)